MNSFSFCLLEKFFPSILNENLAGSSTLRCRIFSFKILTILCHFLLACEVSAREMIWWLCGIPLYMTFFLAPFMPCVGWFGVVLFGILRASCTWESVSFRFRKFSAIISSSTVLMPFSFSGIPIMWILAQFILSHRSCMLFFLSFPPPRPLSFFCSGWVNYSVFQTTYAFFCVINCTSISVCYSLLLECFFMSVTALSIFDWVFIVILVSC